MLKLKKFTLFVFCTTFISGVMQAQSSEFPATDTTGPVTNLNAALLNIFSQKQPHKYRIDSINVTGNTYFDKTLLLSIAGLNVGEPLYWVSFGGDPRHS